MKNLKKLLAVIVAICVLATFTVPAFAEEAAAKTDAAICEDLGVLKGTTSGVDAEYLAKGTQRYQAAVITLRLAGKYEEALAFEGTENFDDAAELEWTAGRPALAYLKANPELGWAGSTSGNFFPYGEASAQMIYKVLLESLGYKQGTDFTWDGTIEFAAEKGLVKVADVAKLTNNDVAIAIVEGLKAKVKDSEATLAETLVEAGAIDKAAAVAAGLYSAELKATVAVTGAKKLTVTFNQAVDTAKATITVKKGSLSVNTDKVEFAEDKKSAVVTTTTNLSKGDYTVTIAGLTETALTATVAAEDVKVTKINITSPKAPRKNGDEKNAYVNYEVLNQYGEKMIPEGITWTISTGKAADTSTNNVLVIESADGSPFIPGSFVYITGVHANSGTVVNTQVEIALASQADTVNFKGAYSLDKSKVVDLPAGFALNKYVLLFEVIDQYGNKIATPDLTKLVFTSNNPLFVGSTFDDYGSEITVDDVDYAAVKLEPGIQAGKGGSVTIQAISTLTGKTSTFVIEAEAAAAVKSFTMSAPGKVVAEGEEIEIPYAAMDQYGNAITKFDSLNGKVTLTPAKGDGTHGLEFVKQKDGSAKLIYTANTNVATPTQDGLVYLTTVIIDGGSNSSLMLNIKDEAVPTVIAGLDKDLVTNVAVGGTFELNKGNIIVQDQYGRDFDLKDVIADTAGEGKYQIVVSAKDAKIGLTGTTITDKEASTSKVVVTGVTKGTTGIVVTLQESVLDEGSYVFADVSNSAYSRNVTVSEKADFESYEIGEIKAIYDSATAGYARELIVYGIKADGSKVVVPSTEYTVTTNNAKLTYSAGKLASDGSIITETGDDDVTVKVTVVVNADDAAVVLTKDVVVTEPALTVAKSEWKDGAAAKVVDGELEIEVSDATTTDNLVDTLKLKDQFDVAYTLTGHTVSLTNLNDKVVDDLAKLGLTNNGTATVTIANAAAGDSFNMTIAVDGKAYTIKVLVIADA